MRIKVVVFTFILFILLALPVKVNGQVSSHPFLLVKEQDFSALRNKSLNEPWKSMKTDAINSCRNLSIPCLDNNSFCIRAIMSSCSLAYILDPVNKNDYLDKVVSTMPGWENIIIVQSGADDGTRNTTNEYYTHATAAYFNTMLAIDVMYPDLQSRSFSNPNFPQFTNQLAYSEFLMEQEYNHFYGITKPVYNFVTHQPNALAYHCPSRHPPAREAAMMIWKIYKGEFTTNDSDSRALLYGGMLNNAYPDPDHDGKNIEGYMPEMDARVNDSGVYTEGVSYAFAAWGLNRDDRAHLIDVLEFTGKDREFAVDFYTNPRYISFYEWLYGYSVTPFGMMASFGDTYAFRKLSDDGNDGSNYIESSHIGQAGIFSNSAGSFASWRRGSQIPMGRLLNYLLYTIPAVNNLKPESRIFANGGGVFIEPGATDNSLYGVLWNVKKPLDGSPVFHIRRDVNAIYIAGYGEPLLMNGGFCGASTTGGPDSCRGPDPQGVQHRFSGNYLGDRSVSNNTALINYTVGNYLDPNTDNNGTFGGGVTEGFTTSELDYVSATSQGSDYNALSGGVHNRNFLFIKPGIKNFGYFILLDEFSGLTNATVNLVFHPNTSGTQVLENLKSYNNPVGQKVNQNSSAGLNLFFASPPSSIQFHKGIIASVSTIGSYVPEYFFNSYPASGQTKNIATVLFPYDATHQKPAMTRISATNYSGTEINHGNGTTDTAITLSTSQQISYGQSTFQGNAVFFRKDAATLLSYFVRKGRYFSFGNPRTGFESDNDVSIFLGSAGGAVYSPGTNITIYRPWLANIFVDGVVARPIESGNGWIKISVSPGSHLLTFTAGVTPTIVNIPADANGDGKVDGIDYMVWLNHFTQTTSLGKSAGDFDLSGRVENPDYTIWLGNYFP